MPEMQEHARVSPAIVVLANFLVGVALLGVAASHRVADMLSRHSVALAALPILPAVLVIAYVFGEDSYRGNGISRWDAYRSPGGALGPMFVLSVALIAVCGALLLYAGIWGTNRLLRVTAFAGGLTSLVLLTATTIAFSVN
jgi:hypothetical protein